MKTSVTYQLSEREATYLSELVKMALDYVENRFPLVDGKPVVADYHWQHRIPMEYSREVARMFIENTNTVVATNNKTNSPDHF